MHTPSCLEELTGFAGKATAGLPLMASSACPLKALPRPHTLRAWDLPAPSEVPRVEGRGLLRPRRADGRASPLRVSSPGARPSTSPGGLAADPGKRGLFLPRLTAFHLL